MKRTRSMLPLLLLALATGAHAQLYKSVGPNGEVTYSDTPPPPSTRIEKKTLTINGAVGGDLPYELAEVVKNNPVTLYSSTKCAPCDEGRKLLNDRGIPFSEKTVISNQDIARLRQVGEDTQLPLLFIGKNKQVGFESSAWNTALSTAGYPETSKLPASYRNPEPTSAAPTAKPAPAAQESDSREAAPAAPGKPAAPRKNDSGFRF